MYGIDERLELTVMDIERITDKKKKKRLYGNAASG